MKALKDNFSEQTDRYKKYRPNYPAEFIAEISQLCFSHELAWDVATGNGQVAGLLISDFCKIIGTDISESQLKNAVNTPKITYMVERAERTSLQSDSADLVAVGQAVHWFDFDPFFDEVNRVLKPGGVVAVFGYGLISGAPAFNTFIKNFYADMEPYWDAERKHIDAAYETIPFPYGLIPLKKSYTIEVLWSKEDILGYLRSWSAVKHFEKKNGSDPVQEPADAFFSDYPPEYLFSLHFPVFYKIGRKPF